MSPVYTPAEKMFVKPAVIVLSVLNLALRWRNALI
jgi:hypothetical protein